MLELGSTDLGYLQQKELGVEQLQYNQIAFVSLLLFCDSSTLTLLIPILSSL